MSIPNIPGSAPGNISLQLGGSVPLSARGVPYPQPAVAPNTQQVRAETAAADAVVPTAGFTGTAQSVTLGAGVPVVFCREVAGVGGCWIAPQVVQCGFQTETGSADVDINYMLVIGQGEYPAIAEADVYYGPYPFADLTSYSIQQTYEELPSNVLIINFFDGTLDAEFPSVIGGGGSMQDLTLLGCYAHLEAPAVWNRQIYVYLRNGVQVTRYVDGVTGSSNNFADLVKYLLASTGELSPALIDEDALEAAALFLDAENFTFNGVLTGSGPLDEYIARTAPLFLCIPTTNNGQRGITPALPVDGSHLINTGFITPDHEYTMADVATGSVRITYVPATQRKAFQAVMVWRDPGTVGATQLTQVGYSGRATNGPFEQYDLSAFCTSEDQAIRVGRYILAQRLYVGHTIQLQLLPQATAPQVGELFRLVRDVIPNGAASRRERYVYRVTAVTYTVDGTVQVAATHFPLDSNGASQIAKEIVAESYLVAQTPEDWSDLPPFDGAVAAATVGGDYIVATGGSITYDGDFKIHTFAFGRPYVGPFGPLHRQAGYNSTGIALSDQLRIVSVPPGASLEYLIVGGGGSASCPYAWMGSSLFRIAQATRGGGAGEVLTGSIAPAPDVYPVVVGANGFQVITYETPTGSNITSYSFAGFVLSGASSLFGLTAAGGQNSYVVTSPLDQDGGDGGTSGAGFAAGANFLNRPSNIDVAGLSGPGGYGGGGGAGGAGAAGTVAGGGDGGAGIVSSITGTAVEYGKGGGGMGIWTWNTVAPDPIPVGDSATTPGSGGGAVNQILGAGLLNMGKPGIVVVRYRYKG